MRSVNELKFNDLLLSWLNDKKSIQRERAKNIHSRHPATPRKTKTEKS